MPKNNCTRPMNNATAGIGIASVAKKIVHVANSAMMTFMLYAFNFWASKLIIVFIIVCILNISDDKDAPEYSSSIYILLYPFDALTW